MSPFTCYCTCGLSDPVAHNQHLTVFSHFLQIFWAWQRKRYTKGNGEQAQQVAATNKAAAWTRRQWYRQKTGEFEKSSYLLGTGRGRSQLLPTRPICQADAWSKGGGLPGAKHKLLGKWFIFGHKLETVKAQPCAEASTVLQLWINWTGWWERMGSLSTQQFNCIVFLTAKKLQELICLKRLLNIMLILIIQFLASQEHFHL